MKTVVALLTLILVYKVTSESLQCWSRTCEGEDWCIQDCAPEETICYGSYRINGTEIVPDLFVCRESLQENECLNTRCELDLSDTQFQGLHDCCCRESFCNVIDDIVDGVTASPQGTVPTPSGTPPPPTADVVCEVFSTTEHIYKECNHCSTIYKLNADMEYVLDEKQCLDAPPPSQSCDQECVLDTLGAASDISCCCSGYLCNEYSMLEFTDPTRVSMYVHQSACDNTTCDHSCAVVNGVASCFCTQGFALLQDGNCEDIDECRMSPCSHNCTNFDGGFRCSCPIGFKLGEDLFTCVDAGLQCWDYSSRDGFIISTCSEFLSEVDYDFVPSCQAVYGVRAESPDTLTLSHAGCFAQHVEAPCRTETCIPEEGINKNVYTCCCTTPLCNGELTLPLSTSTTPTTSVTPTSTNTTDPPTEQEGSLPALVAICVVVAILFLAVCAMLILCFVCHKARKASRGNLQLEAIPLNDMVFEESIELEDEIGRGRFSVVFSGKRNGAVVAVKCFDVKENFSKELSIYQTENFNHKNVLKFLTHVSNADEKKFWIVFEFHKKGSLCSVLTRTTVSVKDFCDIAESIACGLAYLHNETLDRDGNTIKPCIVHRDLKSRNILMKDNGECCISDFGLSVRFPLVDEQGHGQVGTARYMAPEVLEGSIIFTRVSYKQIDCYSLGVILYEVMTRTKVNGAEVPSYSPPFSKMVGPQPTLEDMKTLVDKQRFRPEIPDAFCKDGIYDPLVELVTELWDHFPNARLTAQAAYERMNAYNRLNFKSHICDSGVDIEAPSTPTSQLSVSSNLMTSPFAMKSSGFSTTTETTV